MDHQQVRRKNLALLGLKKLGQLTLLLLRCQMEQKHETTCGA